MNAGGILLKAGLVHTPLVGSMDGIDEERTCANCGAPVTSEKSPRAIETDDVYCSLICKVRSAPEGCTLGENS